MTSIPYISPSPLDSDCRAIELLSPARNLQCGIEALRHGADAVYIGGPGFGARAAAGNSVADIASLCRYAHLFGARVYVTMNTIVYDHELDEVRRQAWQMHEAGVDALIVQDLAILALTDMPPIALHASTQMDNRTPEQVEWLYNHGFRQTVLARELKLRQIANIYLHVPQMTLEAFVHGAVCVSLSGRCYASQYLMGRSANRGECAQVCRLPFDLVDGDGQRLATQRHLLSLCDMNRSQYIRKMIEVGVSSFKIEGRLKDVGYVKNITAYYRRLIDSVIDGRTLVRSSYGATTINFTPDPQKSFNRGFTDYFITGRPAQWSPDTPKFMGPQVCSVKSVQRDHIVVLPLNDATSVPHEKVAFAAGDGLCYLDHNHTLHGFRVNRADGTRLYLRPMPHDLRVGTVLHRNHDQSFDTMLQGNTAERRIDINIFFNKEEGGFSLQAQAASHNARQPQQATLHFTYPHEPARSSQADNITRQLSRLGDTIYRASVCVQSGADCFVPSSILAQWRRELVQAMETTAMGAVSLQPSEQGMLENRTSSEPETPPSANIANHLAAKLAGTAINAYELGAAQQDTPLMTCRHCIRRSMGLCGQPIAQPWHLVMTDGRRLRLQFDCTNCQMLIYADC